METSELRKSVKLLIGFGAALGVGWLSHGPFGRGEAFIARLDGAVQEVVREAEIAGVRAEMQRGPLARKAILSGPADKFQREGQGSLPGLDRRILAIPGMGAVEWTNPPP